MASRRDLLKGAGGIAALGLLGTACGGNTGRSSGEGPALAQWYHQYGEAGTKEAALRYASEFDKATVEVGWFPGDYQSRLSTGLLADKGPDCFESQLSYAMVDAKQIVPLDDILADVKDDFTENDILTNTIDGKTYGVRMIDDPQMLYYRKSMLADAGVDPPETLDDLLAVAKATTTEDVKGLFAGNDGGLALGGVAMHSAGGSWLTEDNQSPNCLGERQVAAFGKLRELFQSKTLLLGAPTDWTDPGAFVNGLCAMQWCGLWAMPGIADGVGDDFGVIPFPMADADGQPTVYNGGWTQFVSSKSQDIDLAKEYVRWLWIDSADLQEDWALNYGFHIPPRKSLAAQAKKLQSGPAADAVSYAQDYGMVDNPFWTPKMATAFSDMLTNILKKGDDPASEAASAQEKVTAELKRLYG